MRIRKLNSVDVKIHDLTKVKLKTAGNTSVVQFTAGNLTKEIGRVSEIRKFLISVN